MHKPQRPLRLVVPQRDEDDPLNVLGAIDFNELAREHRSEETFNAAVRDRAYALDVELSSLGPNPTAAVWERVRRTALLALRANAAPEESRTRADRLWDRIEAAACAAWERKRDRAEHAEAVRARIKGCAAPLRARDRQILSDPGPMMETAALQTVRVWDEALRQPGALWPVLVLLGNVGIGKTLAAAWWLTRSRRGRLGGHRSGYAHRLGSYVTMAELARHYTADYGKPDEEFRELIGERMLVVDELGLERSEHQLAQARDALNRLLDVRGDEGCGTILISNLTKHEILERYARRGFEDEDARMLERLRADAFFVELGGESLRPGTL